MNDNWRKRKSGSKTGQGQEIGNIFIFLILYIILVCYVIYWAALILALVSIYSFVSIRAFFRYLKYRRHILNNDITPEIAEMRRRITEHQASKLNKH
jgi:biopolymer transport protein ExbB/TolQ